MGLKLNPRFPDTMCPMAFVVMLLYFAYEMLMQPERLPLLQ